MSADKTDQLTDYEFEYEWLQDQAYKEMIRNAINQTKINMSDGDFNRDFSMDKAEYEHIINMNESGEYVDFEIPKDASLGKRYSEIALDAEKSLDEDDFVPVDMTKLFGGEKDG